MATIKDVVRNALIRIQKNGQVATPEVYQEAFCEEAKKLNIDISQYNWKTSWVKKFDAKTRNQISKFPLRTQDDFISFLAATITRLNGQESKEQMVFYRDILSIFLRYYALSHPHKNYHNLVKETKDFLDGNSSVSAQTIRERWFSVLKRDMPTESTEEIVQEEKEENLSFFALLLRPSLLERSPRHEKIQKAYNLLQIDIQDVIKDQLVAALEDAIEERLQLDRTFLNATIKKYSKEMEKVLAVVMAKVSSMQIAGEMIFNEIMQDKEKLERLSLNEADLSNFKSDLLDLLSNTQNRFENIQNSIVVTKEGLHKAIHKIGGSEKVKPVIPKGSLDTLTGVYTMDGAKEVIQYQEELYHEYHQSYSVFFVDIDNFKKINEEYSEKSGDKILTIFGRLLKEILRENDSVVRYDGEEFLVILSGMDHFDSSFFAEKIRSQIEESVFVHGQYQMKITVSIGVADRNEGDFLEIVNLSKKRLMMAKKQGYNTIVS